MNVKMSKYENVSTSEMSKFSLNSNMKASFPAKHSAPFYIGSSLFKNKRLKRKRCQWAEARKAANRRKKTEFRKQRFAALKADITIDLLSEDETTEQHAQNSQIALPPTVQSPENSNLPEMPTFMVVPAHQVNTACPPNDQKRSKRKVRQRKHSTPIIYSESIVLSDDDNMIVDLPQDFNSPPRPEIELEPEPEPEPVPEAVAVPILDLPAPILTAQVDEEVSVSIVPRNKFNSGRCLQSTAFPMLPDETTVHTVIANRTYELSLSKLREGLATCGISEFGGEQNANTCAGRKKGNFAPPAVMLPEPVSLKLSSDLSISLISDDDEPPDQGHDKDHNSEMRTSREDHLLQHKQPTSLAAMMADPHQKPRKRKLG